MTEGYPEGEVIADDTATPRERVPGELPAEPSTKHAGLVGEFPADDYVYLPDATPIERFMANDFVYERVYIDDEHFVLQKIWRWPV